MAEERHALRLDMTSAQAAELLERLASDDAFRSELKADAGATLAAYGVDASGFSGPVELPPAAEVELFLRLRDLVSFRGPTYVPFMSCLLWGVLAYAAAASAPEPPER